MTATDSDWSVDDHKVVEYERVEVTLVTDRAWREIARDEVPR